tara:strand:- start:837 stop:1136 length:300 start_codon:yes stop_codon:yes gene_type:complete
MISIDDQVELEEFLEQINYALSLEFKEKWRHKFSESFVSIFQNMIIDAFQQQKPISIAHIKNQYHNKHGYDPEQVKDFLNLIDIGLYHPIVYRGFKDSN